MYHVTSQNGEFVAINVFFYEISRMPEQLVAHMQQYVPS